jgi:hypothetical protein
MGNARSIRSLSRHRGIRRKHRTAQGLGRKPKLTVHQLREASAAARRPGESLAHIRPPVVGRSRRKAGSSSRARQSSCERCRQSGSRFWLRCGGRARSDWSCPLHIWPPCVIARIGSVGRLSLPGRQGGASGKRQDDEYRGEPSMRVHCAENLSRSLL